MSSHWVQWDEKCSEFQFWQRLIKFQFVLLYLNIQILNQNSYFFLFLSIIWVIFWKIIPTKKWLFSNYIVRLFRMHWPPQHSTLCLTHPTHSSIDEWSLLRFNNGKRWFFPSNYKTNEQIGFDARKFASFFFFKRVGCLCAWESWNKV